MKILSYTAVYGLDKILVIAFNIYFISVIAKNLGPEIYGSYSTILAVALYFSFLINLGLDGVLSREISKKSNDDYSAINSVLMMRVGGLFVFISGLAIYFYQSSQDYLKIAVPAVLFVAAKIFLTYKTYFDVNKKVLIPFVSTLFGKSAALFFLFLCAKFDVIELSLYVFFIDALISGVFLIFAFNRWGPKKNLTSLKQLHILGSTFLASSTPILVSLIFSGLFMQVDLYLLGNLQNSNLAAIYSAAINLILPAAFLPGMLVNYFMKSMVTSYSISKSDFEDCLKGITQLYVIMAYAFILFIFLTADTLIYVVYGDRFSEAANVLRVLSVNVIFSFPAFVYCRALIIVGKMRYELYKCICAGVFSLIMNIFLIPVFGLWSCVIVNIASYAIADFVFYLFFKDVMFIFKLAIASLLLKNLRYFGRLKNG